MMDEVRGAEKKKKKKTEEARFSEETVNFVALSLALKLFHPFNRPDIKACLCPETEILEIVEQQPPTLQKDY